MRWTGKGLASKKWNTRKEREEDNIKDAWKKEKK